MMTASAACPTLTGPHATLCSSFGSIHIPINYLSILPVLVLGVGGLVVLGVSAVLPKRSWPGLWSGLTAVVGGISALICIWMWHNVSNDGARLTISDQVVYDHFSVFFALLFSLAVVMGALVSDSYLRREGLDGPESYVLMMECAAGAVIMAEAAGLILLFLGLEILSIALYVLAAYHRRRAASGEAGLKYFILGSFSSAIFLYGVAMTYGATGSTQYNQIAGFLAHNSLTNSGVLLAGMAFMIVGLGFKVAAAPFHFWAPDVYQGSPTPFTGYMAAVAKAAGFAALLRVLMEALGSQQANWRPIIWLLAVLTLIVGSVVALVQSDLKRLFAYSSISQAGYVLIGLQAGSSAGIASVSFYVFTYLFMAIGTFAVISVLQGRGENRNDLGVVRGLGRRQPVLAFAFLVLLLGQAGVPFTSGFLAKFYVITAVIQRGQYPLAVIGMLTAAIAAFFYLRVALLMYASPARSAEAQGAESTGSSPLDAATLGGLEPGYDAGHDLVVVGAETGSGDPDLPAGLSDGPGAAAATSVPGRVSVALLDPPTTKAEVPVAIAVVLAVCVVFTVFAGVSAPVLNLARHASMLF